MSYLFTGGYLIINMKISERLYALYMFFPYIKKPQFVLSYLFRNKVNVFGYQISTLNYVMLLQMFALQRYSKVFSRTEDGLEISLDGENYFYISNQLNKTDSSLLDLLYNGLKDGAYFIDENHEPELQYKKTIKIIQSQNIIETVEGIKYYIDNMGASISEIFVRGIHEHYSQDLKGKIVVDIGASVGDTPLYFASKGAKVYAIEMTDFHYDAMLKNLELNPHLKDKIIPIHVAFGKDGIIPYYGDSTGMLSRQGGTIIIKKFDTDVKYEVQGMTLTTLREKYDLKHIDLLKLDCKGGEFFLKENELSNISTIKIEYYSLIKEHRVESLVNMLKKNFKLFLYKHTPNDTTSLMRHGNILAVAK